MPCEQRDLLMGRRIVEPNADTIRHRKPSAVGRIRNITSYRPFTEARFGTFRQTELRIILGEGVE